ncbi:MAG TPA: hypothetical protein VK691_01825 [Solirubrobacteraceae bacterium]|nr:hypothetical protein [Solirubrobacteraceae bacterium]
MVVLAAALLVEAGPAVAAGCPNEALRAENPASQALPDCRAYEQVSPVEKNLSDVAGFVGTVRGAPSGQAVMFNSEIPYPPREGAHEGSSQLFNSYLSTRISEGVSGEWLTDNQDPSSDLGSSAYPVGETEDLSYTLVKSFNQPPLVAEPGLIEGRGAIYLRDNASGTYRLLFQAPANEILSFFFVAAADSDSRFFFESADRLLPEAAYAGQLRTEVVCTIGTCRPDRIRNMYEWDEGRVSLVDILPKGESLPSNGGTAGSYGPGEAERGTVLPDGNEGKVPYFVQNAVSADGSRVSFTDQGTGRLYMREPRAKRTVPVSEGQAEWQAATPDGSQVFYIEHGELYRFDIEGEGEKREALTGEGASVLGVLGIASDGSYVYFASGSVLAHGAVPGSGNIYVWHEGTISLVTDAGQLDDWTPHALLYLGNALGGPSEGAKTARVSADGRTLMFTSRGNVTGYDNRGTGNDCIEDEGAAPCNEVYVYDAETGQVRCISCNPSGIPARSDTLLYHLEIPGKFLSPGPLYPFDLPRNLTEDGSRVFFETEEALLPKDTNGEMDVYEWEREGAGSCGVGQSDGCLYLISTGQSEEPSYFAEASASGGDVFFFTQQSLVKQDNDELIDMYDAREGGGIAAQNAAAAVTPCLGEACRAAQVPPAALGVPVSQVFSGPGNLAPPVEAKAVAKPKPKGVKQCKKGFVKKKGKCVRQRKAKKSGDRKGSK